MAQAPQGIPSANPLLDFSGLPKFKQIRAEHVSPAIAELLEQCNLVLEQVTQDSTPATWQCVVQCLDDVTERLGRAWGIVSHLHSVLDTPELRDTYNENLPRITEFWTRAGQDERLYKKYKEIAASQAYSNFSVARKKVIENALRDFRLGGAELTEAQKPRYSEIPRTYLMPPITLLIGLTMKINWPVFQKM
jgi:oligopeptidase A